MTLRAAAAGIGRAVLQSSLRTSIRPSRASRASIVAAMRQMQMSAKVDGTTFARRHSLVTEGSI